MTNDVLTQSVTLSQCRVLDSHMAYRHAGPADAPAVLFLHGNPTSSYIWRDVIPHVGKVAHAIAPDLIGFGASGKPDIPYRFEDHVRYLDAFLAATNLTAAYIVAQDWGTALAFHLAARRPEFVRGLAFMEFIRPMPAWTDFHRIEAKRDLFRQFRTPDVGEAMLMDANVFIERVLPGGMKRTLSDEEMNAYRAPFPTRASRLPIWCFPNELPIAGEPADVYQTLERAHAALAASTYPKLLFVGDPGTLVSPEFAAAFASGLTNCRLVHLGPGLHYLQEDHADTIGRTVAEWIQMQTAGAASADPIAYRRSSAGHTSRAIA